MARSRMPSEYAEMCALAAVLDSAGLLWCHVPNEGRRSRARGAMLKRMGLKPGVPDVLIFDRPGAAIEMKRRDGGRASAAQSAWLDELRAEGWLCMVAHGAQHAVEWLRKGGFLK